MNRLMLAGAALLLATAAAVPVVAWSADNPPAASQAAPAQPPGPGPGIMHGRGMGHAGMMGRDGWRHHGMLRRWAQLSPQQRCIDRMAHRAGLIAYTLTKLNLTSEQRKLWDKVEAQLNAAGERQRHLCDGLPTSKEAWQQQTILDRLQRREAFMSAHLHDLQQIRPAMQEFYKVLTPAQQAILNHPFRPS